MPCRSSAQWAVLLCRCTALLENIMQCLRLPLLLLQPIVNAIRATGARNLIAVGAPRSWARIADAFVNYPVNDTNWAAAVHSYWTQSDFDAGFKYCQVRASLTLMGAAL